MKFLWIFLFGATAAFAQTEDNPVELTGTLAKVRAAGAITLAYRESSVPFSYLSARGEPIGYSIELCRKLVEAIGEAVGRELALKWLPVTSETRIEAIASGHADLECGSTTSNLERQKRVAFSPMIFVAGTKLLVKRGSPIRSYRDLAGKTVVVTAGTTNEKAMQEIARRFKIDFKIIEQKDHSQSYAQVESGKADAFATDDVLLYGLLAQHKAQKAIPGGRRVPVLRPVRHHVSPERSRVRCDRGARLHSHGGVGAIVRSCTDIG